MVVKKKRIEEALWLYSVTSLVTEIVETRSRKSHQQK